MSICHRLVYGALLAGLAVAPVSAAEKPQPATAKPQPVAAVPPEVETFLATSPEYDKEWPPEFTQWTFESVGALSSDTWAFDVASIPDTLAVRAQPKTWRAYFHGVPRAAAGDAVWNGKGVAWRLQDSRQLLADAVFATPQPGTGTKTAPRACIAVYTVADNKMIASIEVALTRPETRIRVMKHFSYNRLNLLCEDAKLKRGFTIPDHVPLRLVFGVTAAAEAEAPARPVAVTLEIREGGHL